MAADGPRGVELTEELHPDAVLIDVGLPGLDGYEVARRIRAALTKPVTMDRLAAIIAPRWSARGRGHCQSLYASPIAWRKPVNAGSVFRTAKSRSVGTPIRSSLPFASTSTIRRRAATASAGRLSRARTQARL